MGSGGKTCRVDFGSYAGDGGYGSSNPKSLSFDFKPYLVVVSSDNHSSNPQVIVRGTNQIYFGSDTMYITWTDTGLSWYAFYGPIYQFNSIGFQYYYVAIGF